MFDFLNTVVYANPEGAATATDAQLAQSSGMFSLIWIILMIALFYFMLIRPQKKQEKKQKAMLAALKVGDKVVTIGGICGKITRIKDDTVLIETGSVGNPQERSVIKMERAAIKTVKTIHE